MPPCPSNFAVYGPCTVFSCALAVCELHNNLLCKLFGMTKMKWSVQRACNYDEELKVFDQCNS